MLQQQLASLDQEPLEGGLRWLVPTLVALAAASGAALFFIIGEPIFAGLFLAGCVAMLIAAFAIDRRTSRTPAINTLIMPDHVLVSGALDLVGDPVAFSVALTVAGLRGLGDAAVLLLLKDNSEEAKLKR